jgi:15-cis-phytoene synthase
MTGEPIEVAGAEAGAAADAAADDSALEQSRDYCRRITHESATSFYYGLKLLPEEKRAAMFALYAYMRLIDDIADDARPAEQRRRDLDRWRQRTHAVLSGGESGDGEESRSHPLWPALADAVRRHEIPARVFDAMIAGQEQDLEPLRIQTFVELEEYCYRVAGVVGLASIHVWGFTGGEETEQLALDRGTAFQLTNILRDVREDAGRGRCYFPAQEMAAHDVTIEKLRTDRVGPRFDEFLRLQIDRARSYYERSAPLDERIEPDSRPTIVAMTQNYRGLLDRIATDPRRVLRERVSLPLWSKLRIAWKAVRAR